MSIFEQFLDEEEHEDELWDLINEMAELAALDPDFDAGYNEAEEEQPVNQRQFEALKATLVTSIDADTAWADITSASNLVTFANHGLRLIGQRRQYVGIEIPVWLDETEETEATATEDGENNSAEAEEPVDLSNIGVAYLFEPVPEDKALPMAMPSSSMSPLALRSFVKEQDGRWLILPDEIKIHYLASVIDDQLVVSPVFDFLEDGIEPSGAAHGYSNAFWDDLSACLGIGVVRVPAEPIESTNSTTN